MRVGLSGFRSAGLAMLLTAAFAVGCTGAGTGATPNVTGDPLDNPNPGSDVDGVLTPYIPPPPPDEGGSDPIPAPPPSDPGLTSETGETGTPGNVSDPWYDDTDGGLILVIEVGVPSGGSIGIDLGEDDGFTYQIFDPASGVTNPWGGAGWGTLPYTFEDGELRLPLSPANGSSVYMTVTVFTGEGQTADSHGITLPNGWTLGGGTQGSGGQTFPG